MEVQKLPVNCLEVNEVLEFSSFSLMRSEELFVVSKFEPKVSIYNSGRSLETIKLALVLIERH